MSRTSIRVLVLALLFHGSGIWLAQAEITIRDDFGGVLKSYDAKYRAIADRNEKVVIDGDCASACTIVLGIVPRENVCATERARLGFHLWEYPLTQFMGKVIMVPFPEYRQAELNYLYYDAKVRDWISRHGPQTTEPAWMDGADLAGIYPICIAQEIVQGTRTAFPIKGGCASSDYE